MAYLQRRNDEDPSTGAPHPARAAALESLVSLLLQEMIVRDQQALALDSAVAVETLLDGRLAFQARDQELTVADLLDQLQRLCGLAPGGAAARRTGNFSVSYYDHSYTFGGAFAAADGTRRRATLALRHYPSCSA